MKSARPKVVHEVAGTPMVCHVLSAARTLEPVRIVLVVGYGAEEVQKVVGTGVETVIQSEQRGTGHALLQARDSAGGAAGTVMVLYGDTPLITPETLSHLVEHHAQTRPAITALTCR